MSLFVVYLWVPVCNILLETLVQRIEGREKTFCEEKEKGGSAAHRMFLSLKKRCCCVNHELSPPAFHLKMFPPRLMISVVCSQHKKSTSGAGCFLKGVIERKRRRGFSFTMWMTLNVAQSFCLFGKKVMKYLLLYRLASVIDCDRDLCTSMCRFYGDRGRELEGPSCLNAHLQAHNRPVSGAGFLPVTFSLRVAFFSSADKWA